MEKVLSSVCKTVRNLSAWWHHADEALDRYDRERLKVGLFTH